MRLSFFVMGMVTANAIDSALRGLWWAVSGQLVLLIAMICLNGKRIWASKEQK